MPLPWVDNQAGPPDQGVAMDDALKYLQADQAAAAEFAQPVDPGDKVRAWISGERRDAHGRVMSSAAQLAQYTRMSGDISHHNSMAMLNAVNANTNAQKYQIDWPPLIKMGLAIGVLAFLKWGAGQIGRQRD